MTRMNLTSCVGKLRDGFDWKKTVVRQPPRKGPRSRRCFGQAPGAHYRQRLLTTRQRGSRRTHGSASTHRQLAAESALTWDPCELFDAEEPPEAALV